PDREPLGPADFKIWHTSRISPDSVGRGWTIPADPIRPGIRDAVNELTAKLGSLAVDEPWGVAPPAPDPRADRAGSPSGNHDQGPVARPTALLPAGQRSLSSRLQAGVAR